MMKLVLLNGGPLDQEARAIPDHRNINDYEWWVYPGKYSWKGKKKYGVYIAQWQAKG